MFNIDCLYGHYVELISCEREEKAICEDGIECEWLRRDREINSVHVLEIVLNSESWGAESTLTPKVIRLCVCLVR